MRERECERGFHNCDHWVNAVVILFDSFLVLFSHSSLSLSVCPLRVAFLFHRGGASHTQFAMVSAQKCMCFVYISPFLSFLLSLVELVENVMKRINSNACGHLCHCMPYHEVHVFQFCVLRFLFYYCPLSLSLFLFLFPILFWKRVRTRAYLLKW